MLRNIRIVSLYLRAFMRRFMPTSIVIDELRTRKGIKWGVPTMFLRVVYFYLVLSMCVLVNGGASKWLYYALLVCAWNACKFLIFRPVTLMRVRLAERRACLTETRPEHPLAAA